MSPASGVIGGPGHKPAFPSYVRQMNGGRSVCRNWYGFFGIVASCAASCTKEVPLMHTRVFCRCREGTFRRAWRGLFCLLFALLGDHLVAVVEEPFCLLPALAFTGANTSPVQLIDAKFSELVRGIAGI